MAEYKLYAESIANTAITNYSKISYLLALTYKRSKELDMKREAKITSMSSLRHKPIQFICPNCKQYVAGLMTEAQMMVHFTDTACHFCDHLLTQDNMVSQVQNYAM